MRSLNSRVTVGAGVVLAVFIALSAFALERAFRDSARSARQERLLAQIYLLMAAAEVDRRRPIDAGERPVGAPARAAGFGAVCHYRRTVRDSVVWRSRSALSVDAPAGAGSPPGRSALRGNCRPRWC